VSHNGFEGVVEIHVMNENGLLTTCEIFSIDKASSQILVRDNLCKTYCDGEGLGKKSSNL